MSSDFPLADPEVMEAWAAFSAEEQRRCHDIWRQLLSEAAIADNDYFRPVDNENPRERQYARDAIAAVLQHKRLTAPTPMPISEIESRLALAAQYQQKGLSEEEAEQRAYRQVRRPAPKSQRKKP